MALPRCLWALVALLGSAQTAKTRSGVKLSANPIRRVVTLLQNIQAKVSEEQARDQKLYDKFMCYCKTTTDGLTASIDQAEAKAPQLESSLEEAKAKSSQLEKELEQHKKDRTEARDAVDKAQALRTKEAKDYKREVESLKGSISALTEGIKSIEEHSLGTFLQTPQAGVLRRYSVDGDLTASDRDVLSAFLSEDERSSSPSDDEVQGILGQMQTTMEADLKSAESKEKEAITNFKQIIAAKQKEIAANTKAVEEKLSRSGNVKVEISSMSGDLKDTTDALKEDKRFLSDLTNNCNGKTKQWEGMQSMRATELLVLGDTIKILNSDEALDLFKKTMPSTSLIQTTMSSKEVRRRALETLRAHRKRHGEHDPRLGLVAMAIRGRKMSFEKINTMIDNMLKLLSQEQADDDKKKTYCASEMDEAEDDLKQASVEISDYEKLAQDTESSIKSSAEDIAALDKGIKDLDKSVAEATQTRKEEHKEYSSDLTDTTNAKAVLEAAGKRLRKFYAPALSGAAKSSSAQEDLLELSVAGQAGGGHDSDNNDAEEEESLSFTQVDANRAHAVPPPSPEAVAVYMKKSQETTSVTEMINTLLGDLDKDLARMETSEKDAQEEYEQFIEDSKKKRRIDTKAVEAKEFTKADLEEELEHAALDRKSKVKEAAALTKTLKNLHDDCDWLLANFEVRRGARSGEIDTLQNAKAVLNGADFSLVQTGERHRRGNLRMVH